MQGPDDTSAGVVTPTPESDTAVQPAQATPAQTPSQTTTDPNADDPGDPVLAETMKQLEKDRAQLAEAEKYFQGSNETAAGIAAQIRNSPLPPLPQHMQLPSPPDQQAALRQQRGGVGTILQQAFTLAGIASLVFGRRHNPWAAASIWGGVGSFIEGYMKEKKDLANEQFQNWNRAVEYAQKVNQEADRTYNQVLANNHLSLDQQMDVIKAISAQRQDVEMYKAATSRDLNRVIKVIEDHAKADSVWSRAHIDVGSRVATLWIKSKEGQAWSLDVLDKFHIDPSRSPEDFNKARALYKPSDWIATHLKGGKTAQADYGKLATQTRNAIGKDLANGSGDDPGWIKILESGEKYERGNIEDQPAKPGGIFGWGATPEAKVWRQDPKGKYYSYGKDEDKVKNAAPADVIDSLSNQYNALKANTRKRESTQSTESTDNIPTIPYQDLHNHPAGTIFMGTNGKRYLLDNQNPLHITEIAGGGGGGGDEGDESTKDESTEDDEE